jgi:hypothetical protein
MAVFHINCVTGREDINRQGYIELNKIPRGETINRKNKFNSFNVETQLDTFLFGMRAVNPTDTECLYYLSEDPDIKQKVPVILSRIADTKNGGDKVAFIRLLWEADRKCKCISNDKQVMTILQDNSPVYSDSDGEIEKIRIKDYQRFLDLLIMARN